MNEETTFKSLQPRVDINSPLLISKTPGILTLKDATVMADGKVYLAVYADEWHTHSAGQTISYDSDSVSSRGNGTPTAGGHTNHDHYSIVGFVEGKPVMTIPGSNVRGLSPTNNMPELMGKDIFNLQTFWSRGGLQRFGTFESGEVNSRDRELAGSRR